ncbi:MAG: hypothetical protein ACC652_12980 [Acidimicrobiales bacterium]
MAIWDDLITDLEELLESVQCALESGRWEDLEDPFIAPRPETLPDPTPEQRQQAIALLEEVAVTELELESAMDKTKTELGQGARKRQAARHYFSTSRA